jgi:itaconate CoA-transferase
MDGQPQPRVGIAAPLAGITVVGLEQAVSAPFCTRSLADLGARVVKIENPEGGDFTRGYDSVVHGLAAHFVWVNRGKESVALDLKAEAGREVLHRLLGRADVVVSNLAPGALDRLGLAGAELTRRHSRLVAVEISGYGAGGPLSEKRAYDLLVQAESGVCATTGRPDDPAKAGPPVADAATGLYAAFATLAALREREHTGRGGVISVSMFDTMVEFMGYPLTFTRHTGVDQEPVGLGSPAVVPYGSYRTADGQTAVLGTTNDAEWQRLCAMIDRPDLAATHQYARNADRVVHRAELDAALGSWCAAHTLADVQDAADAAGIGNARYNLPSDVLAHPHLTARERWRDVDTPGGPIVAALPPPVFGAGVPGMGAVPELGEHTADVLAWLGYQETEIAALGADGVIGVPLARDANS